MVIEIRDLHLADAPACDAVIASLPTFFGDPQGIRDCAEAVRSQRGFVVTVGAAVAGFITLKQHLPGSSEITWLAVHADHRRHGLGRRLIDAAVRACEAGGQRALFVLTLGPSAPDAPGDNYAGTRAFYEACGFVPLREFGLRDWNDPWALVLVRPLGPR